MTGTTYSVPPISPDEAHTTYVDAGALRIGLLGVANIAPYALLHPARQLSDSGSLWPQPGF